ncbi:uncharacterized protein WM294_006993 [Sarcoramphus papa]
MPSGGGRRMCGSVAVRWKGTVMGCGSTWLRVHTKPQRHHTQREHICAVAPMVRLQPGMCDIFPNSGWYGGKARESLPCLLNCGVLASCFAATTKTRVPERTQVCDPLCGDRVQPSQ